MKIVVDQSTSPATGSQTANTVNGAVTVKAHPNRRTRNQLLRQYWHLKPRPRFQLIGPHLYQLTF